MKQPGSELIQPAKQLEFNIQHIYAYVKKENLFQQARDLLCEESPQNEPDTAQAAEFLAKPKLKGSFRTPTSLQHFYRTEKADRRNQPQTFANKKTSKQKTMELKEIKDVAYYEGVRTQLWPGLLEVTRGVRGRAIVATTRFQRGDYICNYHGGSYYEAEAKCYQKTVLGGNTTYLYHCNDNDNLFVIDSIDDTKWAPSPGRLINHSIRHPNVKHELVKRPNKVTTLGFKAIRLINPGDNNKHKHPIDAWYTSCPCMKCLPREDFLVPILLSQKKGLPPGLMVILEKSYHIADQHGKHK